MIRDGIRQRLTDSIETALRLSKGVIVADFVDLDEKDPNRRQPFSEHRACPNGHQLQLDEIEPRTFSFNAPYGACPVCDGIGYKLEIDPDLVIADDSKSLSDGVIERGEAARPRPNTTGMCCRAWPTNSGSPWTPHA